MSKQQTAEQFAAQEMERCKNGYTDKNGNYISGLFYFTYHYKIIEGQSQQITRENLNRDTNQLLIKSFK